MFSCKRVANSWNARHSGKDAFTARNAYGYHVGSVNGDILQAHRVIWAIVSGGDAPEEIDHINGDRSDNRLSNLRSVSQSENRKNMSTPKNNTSGVCGVSFDRRLGKWLAKITVDRKQIYIGLYVSKADAAKARKSAERQYGFHENHGRVA